MTWLFIVILAHLFYALVFIIDKYILSQPLPHPIVYAFYVGILGIFILVLIPFGFHFPSGQEIILVLLAGLADLLAAILFYKALNLDEVSRIIPFSGGFLAIFILILSSLTIGERLTSHQYLAFILLVLGSLLISFKRKILFQKAFGLALLSSFLAAIFWVITKYIFIKTSFISGLIWIRTGAALMSLVLLIPSKNRELIFRKTKELKIRTVKFFISDRVLSILAGFLMYLAVFMGSVTLVNSLKGLQYVFILILALLFFRKIPDLREQFDGKIITQKIIAIILIGLGLALLIL
jgi:drug/metabolite transporter (DMT)-like permease